MKLKSITAAALVLTLVPSLAFGGILANIKAHMAASKAKHASAMTTAHKPSMMGGMMHKKPMMGGAMSGMHMGNIIGNKNTKVYHLAGDKSLPDEKNRVYFSSVSAAEAAGYHASKAGAGSGAGKSTMGAKMSGMKHKKK